MVVKLSCCQFYPVEDWINQFNGLRKTITIDKWSFGNHVEHMDLNK